MPRLIVQGPAQVGRQGFVSGSTLGGGVGVATKQLGREISTLGRVLQASSEQAARRKAAEFGIALQDAAVDINLDPNIENREKRFQETQQSLRDKFRPNAFLGSPAIFDTNADISSGRLGVMVKSGMMQDAIARGRADTDFVMNQLANEAALTDNPDDLALSMTRGEIVLAEALETGLLSQSDHDRRLELFNKDVMAGRLMKFLNNDPEAGLEFLESKQFKGDEADRQVWIGKMRSAAESQGLARNSQNISDEIMAALGPGGVPLSKTERLAAAREIEDPKLRDEVVRRVKNRTNEQKIIQQEIQREATERSWDGVLSGGGEEAILDLAPATSRKTLLKFISEREEARAAGKTFVDETDVMVWDKLVNMRVEDPDAFAKLDLWQFRPDIARPDFNELRTAQDALRNFGVEDEAPLGSGDLGAANDLIRGAGIEDPEIKARMRSSYRRAATVRSRELERKLTRAEREEIFDGLLNTEVEVPGVGGMTFLMFGERKRIGDLTPDDVSSILQDPPKMFQTMAIESLKKRGVESPDPDEVRDVIEVFLHRNGAPDVQ